MLEEYLVKIQEGYLLSDKTISVNLDDFESGKKNKLLIVGVMGSGKTTIGEQLAKKMKVKWISIDSFWWILHQKYFKGLDISKKESQDKVHEKVKETVVKFLKSNERLIIEGINIIEVYNEQPKHRKLILNQSMIILGLSSLMAGIRAGIRNKKGGEGWRELYWMPRNNIQIVQAPLNRFRKDVIKMPNVDIQEYKI